VVRVFALDREGVLARLRERAHTLLAENPDVLEVRLFGSLARGDAGPGSDADLLVSVERSTDSPLERAATYGRAFEGAGIACDVVVLTREEQRTMAGSGARFTRMLDAEGVTLARR
jgi:predicted nucleotidyltransferase